MTTRFPDLAGPVDRAAYRTLLEIGSLAQGRIREDIEESGRIDRGAMAQGVLPSAPTRTATGWRQVVAGQADHTVVHEEGRRPGSKMPPVSAIEAWAKRQIGTKLYDTMPGAAVNAKTRRRKPQSAASKAKHARSVAYLIARKIAREGIPGLHMFRRAKERLLKGELRRIFERHVAVERAR